MSGITRDHRSPATRSSAAALSAAAGDQINAPLSDRIRHLTADLSRSFNPLQDECLLDFQVVDIQGERAFVLFEMPVGMTRAFVTMLDSLQGFFRLVDYRSKLMAMDIKLKDPAEEQRVEEQKDDFAKSVSDLFMTLIDRGVDSKEAVKRTNQALKEQGHPWASYDVIRSTLSSSGCLREAKRKEAKRKKLDVFGGKKTNLSDI